MSDVIEVCILKETGPRVVVCGRSIGINEEDSVLIIIVPGGDELG